MNDQSELARGIGITFIVACVLVILVMAPAPTLFVLAIISFIALIGWFANVLEGRSIARRMRREAEERVKAWKRVEEANR